MENLISLFVESVFVNNILLAYFLGMCSFLAVSKRVDTALGLGAAVIFVEVITVPVNWLLNHYLLAPGALAWAGLPDVDLSFLSFISFTFWLRNHSAVSKRPTNHWTLHCSYFLFMKRVIRIKISISIIHNN